MTKRTGFDRDDVLSMAFWITGLIFATISTHSLFRGDWPFALWVGLFAFICFGAGGFGTFVKVFWHGPLMLRQKDDQENAK